MSIERKLPYSSNYSPIMLVNLAHAIIQEDGEQIKRMTPHGFMPLLWQRMQDTGAELNDSEQAYLIGKVLNHLFD